MDKVEINHALLREAFYFPTPAIGEHDIEFALFPLDLCKETIKLTRIRHVSLYASYISSDLLYR